MKEKQFMMWSNNSKVSRQTYSLMELHEEMLSRFWPQADIEAFVAWAKRARFGDVQALTCTGHMVMCVRQVA